MSWNLNKTQQKFWAVSETLTVNPEILPRTTHFDRLGEFEFRHISGWPVDPVYCGDPVSAVSSKHELQTRLFYYLSEKNIEGYSKKSEDLQHNPHTFAIHRSEFGNSVEFWTPFNEEFASMNANTCTCSFLPLK